MLVFRATLMFQETKCVTKDAFLRVKKVSESLFLRVFFFEMQDIILITSTARHFLLITREPLQIAAMNVSEV